MRTRFSRRELAHLLGGGLLGTGVLPGRAFASPGAKAERKFLFVFCEGGFDPTWVFAPMLDVAAVHTDTDVGAELREQGGLRWVHNERRAQVSTFLQDNAHRTCFINGFEVRSVTHEACRRIIMTGGTGSTLDDWPSRIAAASSGALLPSLVLSGPSYTYENDGAVIRVGENRQLARLISGEALADGDLSVRLPSSQARFAEAIRSGIDQLTLVQGIDGLDLSVDTDGWVFASDRVEAALMALELGLSGCNTVEHDHGSALTSQHLGATLLEMAGLDPLAELGVPAIQAAIAS